MQLTESKRIYEANKAKGFWDERESIPEKMQQCGLFSEHEVEAVKAAFRAQMLMLTVSELAEALEADRKGRRCDQSPDFLPTARELLEWKDNERFEAGFRDVVKDTFEDELADAVIRLMDMAGGLGIDLGAHVQAKLRYNSFRPYKHGKRY